MQYTRIELPNGGMQAYLPAMALENAPLRKAIVI